MKLCTIPFLQGYHSLFMIFLVASFQGCKSNSELPAAKLAQAQSGLERLLSERHPNLCGEHQSCGDISDLSCSNGRHTPQFCGVSVLDLHTGELASINGDDAMYAWSSAKWFYVAAAIHAMLEAGLNNKQIEQFTPAKSCGFAGPFSAIANATLRQSDNTATSCVLYVLAYFANGQRDPGKNSTLGLDYVSKLFRHDIKGKLISNHRLTRWAGYGNYSHYGSTCFDTLCKGDAKFQNALSANAATKMMEKFWLDPQFQAAREIFRQYPSPGAKYLASARDGNFEVFHKTGWGNENLDSALPFHFTDIGILENSDPKLPCAFAVSYFHVPGYGSSGELMEAIKKYARTLPHCQAGYQPIPSVLPDSGGVPEAPPVPEEPVQERARYLVSDHGLLSYDGWPFSEGIPVYLSAKADNVYYALPQGTQIVTDQIDADGQTMRTPDCLAAEKLISGKGNWWYRIESATLPNEDRISFGSNRVWIHSMFLTAPDSPGKGNCAGVSE